MVSQHKKINLFKNSDEIEKIGNAISSPLRINILKLLADRPLTTWEICKKLDISFSSATFHIKQLEEAELVRVEYFFKKNQKVSLIRSGLLDVELLFQKDINLENDLKKEEIDIPIGSYTNIEGFTRNAVVLPTGELVDVWNIKRSNAQLLWIDQGIIEYSFSLHHDNIQKLTIGLEICSEAPNYKLDWKSTIGFVIDNHFICEYTSESDFGGRRGLLNPDWWPLNSSQYGKWVEISIDSRGTYLNGMLIANSLTINKLDFQIRKPIKLLFGNLDKCKYVGGINIFSKNFGDIPKNIVIHAYYKENND